MVHLYSEFEAGMNEVTLRDYRAADADAMHALDVLCFEPAFQFSRRVMRGFAEAKGAVTVLAEAGPELVGFCVVQMEEQLGYVVTLDVAASWRRQGLAGRLMEEVESRVRTAGGLGMVLHVYKGNPGAMRFYESMGYGRAGIVQSFYGRGLDALVYRKRW
jgi:ribosomal-protein-alanine N-acetyltransferase